MRARFTPEEFLQRARAVHGDNLVFDDRFTYQGTKVKATVLCPVADHGYFDVVPESLISTKPSGCPKCAFQVTHEARRSDTSTFVAAAQHLHPGYNYDKTVYVKSCEKVIIICDKGHEFTMTPNHHLAGKKCATCVVSKKKRSFSELIEEAKQIHKKSDGTPKFDYSMIDQAQYEGTRQKLSIKCNQCQTVFQQCMNDHVTKQSGCRVCSIDARRKVNQSTNTN